MNHLPEPGTTIHALDAIVLCDVALRRGDSLVLTQKMIDLTINAHGKSFLSIVDDEDAQIEKWGAVKIGLGPFPDDLTPWVKGSPDEDIERDRRMRLAWAKTNPTERYDELEAIHRELGSTKTSRTLRDYK
ncbi:hypothetical protein [Clavibacter nebraskensis]|uniref:hypothetical protein n=1 Tax=Clavibacter nebraskensis TaxID=31963 RepID=UPI00200F7F8E|nr:hypothetical protein [Clavibacter nebraskensis]UQB14588.1 hypothetical protein LIX20_001210 [Clavibacter nebraskensis]UQB17420.1 hypothetical protein LIX22_001209 [Clavibacter nebraskensis]